MAMGYEHYLVERDFRRAGEEFSSVIQQSPNDAWAQQFLAKALRRQGRLEESLAAMHRSLELDPENNGSFSFCLEVLEGLRRFAEINTAIDQRLALYTQVDHLRLYKARVFLLWRADTRAARVELARLPTGFDPDGVATFLRLECGALERDFAAMARDLAACPSVVVYNLPRGEQFAGHIARYRGERAAAATAYEAARQRLEAMTRAQPDNADVLLDLALVDASLGRLGIAFEEGRRALASISKDDARDWPDVMLAWAKVLARAGEREQAVGVLQTLGIMPYGSEYGLLHRHPDWDNLRGDPRFEALVASLAPKP